MMRIGTILLETLIHSFKVECLVLRHSWPPTFYISFSFISGLITKLQITAEGVANVWDKIYSVVASPSPGLES
eukprot:4961854-Ditylum_brightwellii.AAC.1